jgi:hypothetical protein
VYYGQQLGLILLPSKTQTIDLKKMGKVVNAVLAVCVGKFYEFLILIFVLILILILPYLF